MALGRMNVIKRHLSKSGVKLEYCSAIMHERKADVFSDREFRYTLNNSVLTRDQRIFYENNGFLVIPDLLEEHVLDSLGERFVDLCEGRVPKGSITLMKDISLMKKGASGQFLYNKAQEILYDDVFEKYFFCDKVLDVVECFTGPNILGIHSMLINKPPDSGALTSRHPPHQDLHYFPYRPADRIVASWTALEDVTIDNGCLFVIPASHKGPLLVHKYPEWEGGVNKAYHGIQNCDYDKAIPIAMSKGETVFFHPLLIHGSGANMTQGFRKAISGHYAAAECELIDVKGTIQDEIAREVEDMAKKKWQFSNPNFQEIWRMKSRLLRGSMDS